MTKIAYNACYGGFSLSRAAVLLGRKLSKDPAWCGPCIKGDVYGDGTVVYDDYGGGREMSRTDPTLIEVIETLGEDANGMCAELKIKEVEPGTLYRIDEYDGFESVMTRDDYDWQTAGES